MGRAGKALILAPLIGLLLACVLWWKEYIKPPISPSSPEERYAFHRLGPLAAYLADPSAVVRPIRVSYKDFGGKYYLFLPFKRPLPVWVEGKGFIQLMDVKARFLNVSRTEIIIGVILYLDRPFKHFRPELNLTEHVKGFFDGITYRPMWNYDNSSKDYVLVDTSWRFNNNKWDKGPENGTYWGLEYLTRKIGEWITIYPGVEHTPDTLVEIKKRKIIGVMILMDSPQGLVGEVDLSKAWFTYTEIKS